MSAEPSKQELEETELWLETEVQSVEGEEDLELTFRQLGVNFAQDPYEGTMVARGVIRGERLA